ncbi:MAG TPA: L,D-transpeptidase [Actinomycetota bacterium]|nr:L,D-transpeptidase [Actinomycetota bacterium]
MLPAATWVTAAALVAPVMIALTGTTAATAGPNDSASPGPTDSISPSASPSPTDPTGTPEPSPSESSTQPTPTPTATTPTVTPQQAMEVSLRALGLPTGAADGVVNRNTRRAICAYRDLNGLPATRRPAGPELMAQIAQATELPLLPRKLFGVKALVSLTCQTAYITNNAGYIVRVLPVSTGKDNGYHQTRTGFKRVYYKVNAWQASTLFPEPDGRPGMYRPIYFDRGIAFHGVRQPIYTSPKSHGCVRTWPKDQDWLWKRLHVRDRVFVYGNYWRAKTAPLGGYGRR